MARFERKPEVVEAWRTRGDRIVDTFDGPKKAQPGQWIVPDGDGIYFIMGDAEFRDAYEAKDKDAKKMLDAELVTADEAAAKSREDAAEEASVAVGNDPAEKEKPKKKDNKSKKSVADKKAEEEEDEELTDEEEKEDKGDKGSDGDKDK